MKLSRIGSTVITKDILAAADLLATAESFHCRIPPSTETLPDYALSTIDSLGPPTALHYAIICDGNSHEGPVQQDYPSTLIGIVNYADVALDLNRLREAGKADFVDPLEVKESLQLAGQSLILPSSCVAVRPHVSLVDSWRETIYQQMEKRRLGNYAALDFLAKFLARSNGRLPIGVCPTCHHPEAAKDQRNFDIPVGISTCPRSECSARLYTTDVLRVHRDVEPNTSNAEALTKLRRACVQLSLQAYVAEAQDHPDVFQHTVFVVHDALALFGGPAAGLLRPIRDQVMPALFAAHAAKQPKILGLLTSGPILEHARGIQMRLPAGTLMVLSKTYLAEHIQDGEREWGESTHYSQPFIYKTKGGVVTAFTLPTRGKAEGDSWHVRHYPELATILSFIERIAADAYRGGNLIGALSARFTTLSKTQGRQLIDHIMERVRHA